VVDELKLRSYQKRNVTLPSKLKKLGHEGDILLTLNGKESWLSLKLAKANSYINTKSGGIKSFLTSYFPFGSGPQLQTSINENLDEYFYLFAKKLHALQGLSFAGDFSEWRRHGLTELPGELKGEAHDLFLQFLGQCRDALEQAFKLLQLENPDSFTRCLRPLLGITAEHVTPLYVFYHEEVPLASAINPVLPQYDSSDILKHFEWRKNAKQLTSFALQFSSFELQIRIKPMNVFSVSAPKVNCSVKWR
jgi:hypothetical protein